MRIFMSDITETHLCSSTQNDVNIVLQYKQKLYSIMLYVYNIKITKNCAHGKHLQTSLSNLGIVPIFVRQLLNWRSGALARARRGPRRLFLVQVKSVCDVRKFRKSFQAFSTPSGGGLKGLLPVGNTGKSEVSSEMLPLFDVTLSCNRGCRETLNKKLPNLLA